MTPPPSSPRPVAGHEPSPELRRTGRGVPVGGIAAPPLPSPAPTSLVVAFSPGAAATAAANSGGGTALVVLPSNPAPAPRPPSPPPGPQPSRGARPLSSTSEFRGVTKHK